ncbi:toxin [Rhodococcus sp. NCIMB 12038]|uniref:Tc toxin subunit A-related protein n=1 Tax=Rhodococcus sp. NCIMB 12038 TaxID=933800 RepID=UPI000B3C0B78|nr:toxin [Rhodococcus sp. NCIMB 12038]OUS97442.1 toxin [Rhodococcus sp. NCIMB 12038]
MSGIVTSQKVAGFHELAVTKAKVGYSKFVKPIYEQKTKITYTFYNHFHPYVAELVEALNRRSLQGLLDVDFHADLVDHFFKSTYAPNEADSTIDVDYFPKQIDVSEKGPYSIYNWELLFHVPYTVAVHLSKNQRFAESQRWFHYIFDPTTNDTTTPDPDRYWKFLRFRQPFDATAIDVLLQVLAKPVDECSSEEIEAKELILSGYEAVRAHPFMPHRVARTRIVAYQYAVVMKYLDNLIAWGDSLFRQDTSETVAEATQIYVLAANLLGRRPQQVPERGVVRPKSYAQLKNSGLDPFSNALVDLEGKFPFNLAHPATEGVDSDGNGPLFGLARTLYFRVPPNEKLLGYWDIVGDRLFKLRHCMNIEGVVRQLPLFEPPIDPGMLVKAAAAGIDIASLVSGLNQPMSTVRARVMIQKALELCSEVRAMGANLLSAVEKHDSEALARLRQKHEISLRQLTRDVRFLEWKEAESATENLRRSYAVSLERYQHYRRLLGLEIGDTPAVPELSREPMTEETFDELYEDLVAKYDVEIPVEGYPTPSMSQASSPSTQSGASSGTPNLHLTVSEDKELNEHPGTARDLRTAAAVSDGIHGVLALLPLFSLNVHYWGIGGKTDLAGGPIFAGVGRIISTALTTAAANEDSKGQGAGKTGSHERRGIEWVNQHNVNARELQHLGRQIIGALIREQVTRHDYDDAKTMLDQAEEIDEILRSKFSNQELYAWLQGELSKLYYEYYKFAFDNARRAERTAKVELMRPEFDAIEFTKFNYWDGGRRGLLAGEALYLDVKRLDLAFQEHNKRELELTKHVSLRQLDPVALLSLKVTGSCEVSLPEWFFDLDGPGHYMRRLRNVAVTLPAVTGPYTTVNCTLSLLRSSIRLSPVLADGEYMRTGSEDGRFVDSYGTIQSIVTSGATNDSGMYNVDLRDDRFLPFEGAGAISTWRIELPPLAQFDYDSIADVVLHLRYTARDGGAQLRQKSTDAVTELLETAGAAGMARLFSLRHEFPNEWNTFAHGNEDLTFSLRKDHFPHLVRTEDLTLEALQLYRRDGYELAEVAPAGLDLDALATALNDEGEVELALPEDNAVLARDTTDPVFLVARYSVA